MELQLTRPAAQQKRRPILKPNPVLLLMLEQTRELLREEYLLLQMRKVLLRLKARITDSLF